METVGQGNISEEFSLPVCEIKFDYIRKDRRVRKYVTLTISCCNLAAGNITMNGSLSVPIKLTEISLINMEDYSRKDVWEDLYH
jgi:hypothetical protein